MQLELKCAKCSDGITHSCGSDARAAALNLLKWSPEDKTGPLKAMRCVQHRDHYQKGDEDAPFMSEAFLYPMLGKEDARTLLALIYRLILASGLDPHALEDEASR